jgi:hypothetical protein
MSTLNVGKVVATGGGVRIPSVNSSNRPSTPLDGTIIHNTDINNFEYWNGSSWTAIGISSIIANGGQDTYEWGGYKIHAFTGTGTFTVTTGGYMDVLLVAGGGGGGCHVPGGGGAGGVVIRPGLNVAAGTYAISVGNGGVRSSNTGSNPTAYVGMPNATVGGDTTAFGLTAKGGGFGGSWSQDTRSTTGGSSGGRNGSQAQPGAPTQPSQGGDSGTYGLGNWGENGQSFQSSRYPGGGGGGAGCAAQQAYDSDDCGDGGDGINLISMFGPKYGENGWFAGGGGGGSWGFGSVRYKPGLGRGYRGRGGGGYGDSPNGAGSGPSFKTGSGQPTGGDGYANTGGGGGGGGARGGDPSQGGNGGSGIVLIRYVQF